MLQRWNVQIALARDFFTHMRVQAKKPLHPHAATPRLEYGLKAVCSGKVYLAR